MPASLPIAPVRAALIEEVLPDTAPTLRWTSAPPPSSSGGPALLTPSTAPTSSTRFAATPYQTSSAVERSAPAAPISEAQLSDTERAALLARGDALLSTGDATSARLFYERAAAAGDGLAALRLGETFDPVFLGRARLRDVPSDLATAVSWYHRAQDLGVTGAEVLLKGLETK
jgi:TPR repeat protein